MNWKIVSRTCRHPHFDTLREAIGDFKNAIKKQLGILRSTEKTWDTVSEAQTLTRLYLEDHQPLQAWQVIMEHSSLLEQIEGWQCVGLGRAMVKSAFDIAKKNACPLTSREAFKWACDHEQQLKSSSLEIMRVAVEAAKIVGEDVQSRRFLEAAKQEQQRIDEMLGQSWNLARGRATSHNDRDSAHKIHMKFRLPDKPTSTQSSGSHPRTRLLCSTPSIKG